MIVVAKMIDAHTDDMMDLIMTAIEIEKETEAEIEIDIEVETGKEIATELGKEIGTEIDTKTEGEIEMMRGDVNATIPSKKLHLPVLHTMHVVGVCAHTTWNLYFDYSVCSRVLL